MTKPTKLRRLGRNAPTPTVATLSYWYGLSGACATVLLALYQAGPRGRRLDALMETIQTDAEPGIVKVYICHLRAALAQALDGADVIATDWERAGPRSDCRLTRYWLRPAGLADVRECLEMAHEELSDVLASPKRRAA